jgi:hypothetical protein
VVICYDAFIKNHCTNETKLNPFLELARARFPDLDSGEALKRLSEEIKDLENQTKELENVTREEKAKRIAIENQLKASNKERLIRVFHGSIQDVVL